MNTELKRHPGGGTYPKDELFRTMFVKIQRGGGLPPIYLRFDHMYSFCLGINDMTDDEYAKTAQDAGLPADMQIHPARLLTLADAEAAAGAASSEGPRGGGSLTRGAAGAAAAAVPAPPPPATMYAAEQWALVPVSNTQHTWSDDKYAPTMSKATPPSPQRLPAAPHQADNKQPSPPLLALMSAAQSETRFTLRAEEETAPPPSPAMWGGEEEAGEETPAANGAAAAAAAGAEAAGHAAAAAAARAAAAAAAPSAADTTPVGRYLHGLDGCGQYAQRFYDAGAHELSDLPPRDDGQEGRDFLVQDYGVMKHHAYRIMRNRERSAGSVE